MSYILKLGQSYISADGTVVADQRDAVRVPDGTRLVHLKRSRGTRDVYYPGLGWSAEPNASPAPLSPDGRYDDTDF